MGLIGKGRLHEQTHFLESEVIRATEWHASSGVLCGGDEPPWLLGLGGGLGRLWTSRRAERSLDSAHEGRVWVGLSPRKGRERCT